ELVAADNRFTAVFATSTAPASWASCARRRIAQCARQVVASCARERLAEPLVRQGMRPEVGDQRHSPRKHAEDEHVMVVPAEMDRVPLSAGSNDLSVLDGGGALG